VDLLLINGNPITEIQKITVQQTPNKGVTVIIHGFSLSGDAPKIWMKDMGKAIGERSGTTNGAMNATVLWHNSTTGKWDYVEGSNNPNEEIILLYDWGLESNNLENGWAEAAGDNLRDQVSGNDTKIRIELPT
jgi:hypothetical protein